MDLEVAEFFVSDLEAEVVVQGTRTESGPDHVISEAEDVGSGECSGFRVHDRGAAKTRWDVH